MLIFSILLLLKRGEHPWHSIPEGKFKHIACRMVCGTSTFALYTWGVNVVPLSLAIIIIYLQPFWTSLVALKTHGEVIIRQEYIGMIVCFLGVIGLALGS